MPKVVKSYSLDSDLIESIKAEAGREETSASVMAGTLLSEALQARHEPVSPKAVDAERDAAIARADELSAEVKALEAKLAEKEARIDELTTKAFEQGDKIAQLCDQAQRLQAEQMEISRPIWWRLFHRRKQLPGKPIDVKVE